MRLTVSAGLLAAAAIFAQQAPRRPAEQPMQGARELFYLSAKPKDVLPPIRRAAAPRRSGAAPQQQVDPQAAVLNLGLRYNVVLVTSAGGKAEQIDPDQLLRNGDCFALDLESNRSGYLYVLAKQASGNWQPLLPSPEMADESNVIDPGKRIRVPAAYCFEVRDPPGTENLFIVLSRDPSDFYELYQQIKTQWSAPAQPTPETRPPNPVQYASLGVGNSAVAQMARQFGTRDIAFRKIDRPASPQEPPHSVYVVNNSPKPVSSLVTQIAIRHR